MPSQTRTRSSESSERRSRLPTEARQAEIVEAALLLAGRTSPPLITTAAIAEEIGVTQGALFRHFDSKDAIWLAAMKWVRKNLLATVCTAAASSDSPLEALGAVFDAHIDFVDTHPGVPRFLFNELQSPPDSPIKREVRAMLSSYRKLIAELLQHAIDDRELRADLDCKAAVSHYLCIVQGMVLQSTLVSRAGPAGRADRGRVFAIYLRGMLRR